MSLFLLWQTAYCKCPKSEKSLSSVVDSVNTASGLRSRVAYTTLINKLMPSEFTLTELEETYKSIMKTTIDKRNFRKKILKLKILKELPRKRTGGTFRPAQLYSFVSDKVDDIEIL